MTFRCAKILAASLLVVVPTASLYAAQTVQAIRPADLKPVRKVDERFQSFQVGFSHLTGGETWKAYDAMPSGGPDRAAGIAGVREARAPADLTNRRLRALTRALGPMYVRFSGTTANSVYFHDSDGPLPAKPPEGFTVALTRGAWKGAVDFAKAVDGKILTSFANSEGVRDAAHAWTPRMAAPWLAYTRSIGGEVYAAELFNEPNAPEPPRMPKGHDAAEVARDFTAFRTFMKTQPGIKVAGPGTATMGVGGIKSIEWVTAQDYASATPAPKFDIFSYHFYPALAQRCAPPTSPQGISVDKALTEEWLARPDAEFQRQKAVRDRYAPGAPIWLTETGGAACGGLTWQPTFLDIFRFVDTEARLAKQGVDAMFTHALISGSNGVIDEKTFQPNASYWAAVLWRRLMGTQVLDAGASTPGMHLYAQCLRGVRGGVALVAINLGEARAFDLPGRADVYALTAPELQSRTVLLNGKALALGADDALPTMAALKASGKRLQLAPTSVNFIALPGARNAVCTG